MTDTPPDEPLDSLPLFPATAEPSRATEAAARTPESAPEPIRPGTSTAPRRLRFQAGLVDVAVHGFVLLVAIAGASALGAPDPLAWPGLALFVLAFSFPYHAIPLMFWGRTPGMAAAGLAVRSRDGGPLDARQAVRRWLGLLVTAMLCGLPTLAATRGTASLADRLSASVTLVRRG